MPLSERKKIIFLFAFLLNSCAFFSQSTTQTFNYTGSPENWIVPPCVTSINYTVAGAEGGGANGGNGALVTGVLAVTPGQTIQFTVGGQGACPGSGYNGGGVGVSSSVSANTSCGGGGASDIRLSPFQLNNRIVVASGGGGMGGGTTDANGGGGGCASGINGSSPFGVGGFGGTQNSGGNGGPSWISSGNAGSNGTLLNGGSGGSDPCYNLGPGGGGGGGYYGGGGGGSDCFSSGSLGGGGGGGGSSLVPAGASCSSNNNSGNGYISITYVLTTIPISASNTGPYCEGETIQLNGSGGGTYSWTGPNGFTSSNQNPIIPNSSLSNSGTYTLNVTLNGCTESISTTVVINPPPTLSVNNVTICEGETTTLTATPSQTGGSYLWSNGSTSQSINVSPTSSVSYTVTYSYAGCQPVTASGTVTVTPLPNVSILPNAITICEGESSTLTATPSQPGGAYSWSPGGQTTSSITVNPLTSTSYTVTYTLGSCTPVNSSATITVNPAPTVSVNDVTICDGDSAVLTATPSQPGGTYSWSPGGQTTPSITVNPSTNTSYTVTYTLGGCTPNNATGTVTVTPAPTLTVNNETICEGDTTSLTAVPSLTGGSFTWGTSNSASIISGQGTQSLTVNPNNTTSYMVTYTLGGCTPAIGFSSVTVDTLPIATYSPISPQICNGENVLIDLFGNLLGTTFSWTVVQNGVTGASSGNGNQINQALTNAGSIPGTVIYTVTPSSISCVGNPIDITVIVDPSPTVSVNNVTICDGDSAVLTATPSQPGGTYSWSPGGQTTPSITVNPSTTSSYTVTYTLGGCTPSNASGTVTVTPAPPVSVLNDSICDGDTSILTALPSQAGGTYLWSNGATTQSITVNPSVTTSYSVIYTLGGCSPTNASAILTVSPAPTLSVSNQTICEGDTTSLTAVPSIPGGSYTWGTSNSSSIISGQNTSSITVNPSNTTSYMVTYTLGGCTPAVTNATVTVDTVPVLTYTLSVPQICSGDLAIIDLISNLLGTTFSWTVVQNGVSGASAGSGSQINQVLTATGNTAGTAVYTVTPSSVSCVGSPVSITVVVNPIPTVTVTPQTQTIYSGQTASLSASSNISGGSYLWSPGGQTTSNITVSPTVTTTYSAVYTLNGCSSLLDSGIVIVIPAPTVSVNSLTICDGQIDSLIATPSVPGGTYLWSPTNDTTSSIFVSPSINSIYTVTYTINGYTTAPATATVNVIPLPVVTLSGTTICENQSTTLTPTVSIPGGTYLWSPGGQTTPSITVNPTTTTSYTLDYSVNGCSSLPVTVDVIVDPQPLVVVSDDTICSGDVSVLTAVPDIAGGIFLWSYGSSTSASISVSPVTTSTYNVLYDLNGCVATATGTVVVNPIPTVTLSSSVICDGDSATLTATPSSFGGIFTWMPGGVGPSTLTVGPTTTTSYSVHYNLNGCLSTSATGNVVVNPIPQVTLPNISVCAGDNATLTATPSMPGGVYTWNPGGIGPQTISMSLLSSGTIDVTYELNGCTSSVASSQITVNPLPVVTFIADTLSGCSPLSVNLSADVLSSGADYVWNISNGVSQTGSTANVTFTIGGTYDVTLSVTENGCYNSSTVQNYIYVEDSPTAMFTPSINTFTDLSQEVTFLNTTTGANTYLWNFGDGSTSTEIDPTNIFSNTTNGYDITLIANSQLGCIDSLIINIPYEEGLVFYIPNTFTPDGDIVNQVFTPVFTSGYDPSQFKMTIYNRWGELIFETNNSEIGWDGSYGVNGRKVQEGVYTYHIMYKIPTKDERRIVTGHVNLIK